MDQAIIEFARGLLMSAGLGRRAFLEWCGACLMDVALLTDNDALFSATEDQLRAFLPSCVPRAAAITHHSNHSLTRASYALLSSEQYWGHRPMIAQALRRVAAVIRRTNAPITGLPELASLEEAVACLRAAAVALVAELSRTNRGTFHAEPLAIDSLRSMHKRFNAAGVAIRRRVAAGRLPKAVLVPLRLAQLSSLVVKGGERGDWELVRRLVQETEQSYAATEAEEQQDANMLGDDDQDVTEAAGDDTAPADRRGRQIGFDLPSGKRWYD